MMNDCVHGGRWRGPGWRAGHAEGTVVSCVAYCASAFAKAIADEETRQRRRLYAYLRLRTVGAQGDTVGIQHGWDMGEPAKTSAKL